MKIGYMRISTDKKPKDGEKADRVQTFDLQRDALIEAGVQPGNLYQDKASGKKDDRPGLEACLKALRHGDTLIVWRLDRLGRSTTHLIKTVLDLAAKDIGFKCLTGADIDTTSATGRLVLSIFASFADFKSDLIRERVNAGLEAARARGRKGGRKHVLTPAKLGTGSGCNAEP